MCAREKKNLEGTSPLIQARGWKLFFLMPRLILHTSSRKDRIAKSDLQNRIDKYNNKHWRELYEEITYFETQQLARPADPAQREKNQIT